MALCIAGGSILRTLKPILVKPSFAVPSSLNLQVRHAARKGYRLKAEKKKKAMKLEKAASAKVFKLRKGSRAIQPTVDTKKPEIPDDDIIIRDDFKFKRYSISEAVELHREYHHPTVYNNPNSYVKVKVEFNLTGKTSNQFIKPFSGVAHIPYPFQGKRKREVLVFCNPEDVESSLKSGASVAGGHEVVKKVQEGLIQLSLYEYLLCHVKFFQELLPIRKILKERAPKLKNGTLTADLKYAIERYLHGIQYECHPTGDPSFGFIECEIGTIEMKLEHLEANFEALLKDVMQFKPKREGDFVTWIWCKSPPSDEEFCINITKYIKTEKVDDDDDDDEDEVDERVAEAKKLKQLQNEMQENILLSKNE